MGLYKNYWRTCSQTGTLDVSGGRNQGAFMFRVVSAAVGLFVALASTVHTSAPVVPYASIRPLQNAEGKNICTASSINQEKRYWLTARHCLYRSIPVMTEDGLTALEVKNFPYMAGQQVTEVRENDADDTAVVASTVSAPALHLSARHPQLGDRVTLWGYAFGLQSPLLFQGYVACLDCDLDREQEAPEGTQTHYMMFDMAAAGGDSGSPVLDAQGHVISVLQIGMGSGSAAVSGGVRYWELVRSTVGLWGR